jgi:hypothetical protein
LNKLVFRLKNFFKSFSELPENVPPEHYRFYVVGGYSFFAALLFHFFFIFLKMNLGDVDEKLSTKDFYGKAMKHSDAKGKTYAGRFTSVPPEVDGYLQALRQHAVKPGEG